LKEGDSTQKTVYHCNLCDKWYCETHSKPKFPYFVDWENSFDVQGDPEVKALFFSEYRRNDGHSDFVYLRKTIEALDLEEKTRNELIKQAMDRMNHPNAISDEVKRKENWERYVQIMKDKESTDGRKEDSKYDEDREKPQISKPKRFKEVMVSEGDFHFVKKRVEVDIFGRAKKEKSKKH
jgi:hypothetical protein